MATINEYPVKLTTEDGTLVRNCRMVYHAGRTTVYRWDTGAGMAVPVATGDGPPVRIGATRSFEVRGIRVDPQRGCGCSHPMYTWAPPA